jgi:hypothetical protein
VPWFTPAPYQSSYPYNYYPGYTSMPGMMPGYGYGYQSPYQGNDARIPEAWWGGDYTLPSQPGQKLPSYPSEPADGYKYQLVKVGEIDRAPMAMFEHQGELVISAITRNGISETPVWSYQEGEGVQKRSKLPEQAESGHYGYSFGDGFHLTPESHEGMVDYTASSPDGPWTKHDYSHLNPHSYKNLKWGFSYKCPVTDRQFMGFGNSDHPGVVISYNSDSGEWETFAAPEDMRFPTGLGVITGGSNNGSVLISSCTYGSTRIHLVDKNGNSEKVKDFGQWGVVRADHNERVAYFMGEDGKVFWSSFDDLHNWKECKYQKPAGEVDHVEGLGEPNIHPQTGRMIFPAVDGDNGNTGFYEASREGSDIVLKEVAWLGGVGQWGGKSAVVGDDFYFGSGITTGKDHDRTPGAIYRLELVS